MTYHTLSEIAEQTYAMGFTHTAKAMMWFSDEQKNLGSRPENTEELPPLVRHAWAGERIRAESSNLTANVRTYDAEIDPSEHIEGSGDNGGSVGVSIGQSTLPVRLLSESNAISPNVDGAAKRPTNSPLEFEHYDMIEVDL